MLLGKKKYLGFISKIIDWFSSYLKKRNIVVSFRKLFRKQKFWIAVSLSDQY